MPSSTGLIMVAVKLGVKGAVYQLRIIPDSDAKNPPYISTG